MANGAQKAAEAAVAESDKEVARERADYHERIKGKPTPTQKECDLIKAGAPPDQKEPDGAGPDPRVGLTRSMESTGAAGSYATRATRPTPTTRTPPAAE